MDDKVNGSGSVFLVGLSVKFSHVIFFGEKRMTDTSLSFKQFLGGSLDTQINTNTMTLGLGYRSEF